MALALAKARQENGELRPLEYRWIRSADIEEAAQLMVLAGASFARGTSLAWFRALCRDACAHAVPPCAAVLLAADSGRLTGYVILHLGGPAFFQAFARRHPVAAGQLVWKRLMRRWRQSFSQAPNAPAGRTPMLAKHSFVLEQTPPCRWDDPGLQIARVQHVGVHPALRGAGIGKQIYLELLRRLPAYGVTRVDANIDPDNLSSLWLHHRTGWRVYANHDHYYATVELH
jgi:ribosomal protein S18 acetylase RimI-like enzyme